jgi:large subunit ribosomal protein L7Ae
MTLKIQNGLSSIQASCPKERGPRDRRWPQPRHHEETGGQKGGQSLFERRPKNFGIG